jgi:hypothetical protein
MNTRILYDRGHAYTTIRESAMSDPSSDRSCLACQRGSDATPLLRLAYLDSTFWICPQHLPILIHDPARLVGLLPGAERLSPADHHD